jgi:type II secretory ATPase GspE/PulE/Tfp pilus assembly ATPase PilB-like protein
MVTMRADGLSKVANGITSLAELARVLGGSAA